MKHGFQGLSETEGTGIKQKETWTAKSQMLENILEAEIGIRSTYQHSRQLLVSGILLKPRGALGGV